MISNKNEPDYIKELNSDIEAALHEALEKFCKSSNTSLGDLRYKGFTMSHYTVGQIDFDWNIEAVILQKPEVKV